MYFNLKKKNYLIFLPNFTTYNNISWTLMLHCIILKGKIYFIDMDVSAICKRPLNKMKEDMINLREGTNHLVYTGHLTMESAWRNGHQGLRESSLEANLVSFFSSIICLIKRRRCIHDLCASFNILRTKMTCNYGFQMAGTRLSIHLQKENLENGSWRSHQTLMVPVQYPTIVR